VTGNQPQTIAFPALTASLTYGQPLTLTLKATASSGLGVLYSVSGPATTAGNVLSFTGAGTVVVTANQPGNGAYAAASPVQQTIQVAKAAATVTASDVTQPQGVPLPPFTGYAVTGLVGNDTQVTAFTGSPVLTAVDPTHNNSPLPAGSTPAVGSYPITIRQGSLASANYTFSAVNGTLTVITGKPQTIAFASLPPVTYGAAPIALSATASSGLGVSYTATGLAKVTANMLSVTGAGTVTVVATQAGNGVYAGRVAAIWSRLNFFWDTLQYRLQNVILGRSRRLQSL